MWIEIARPESPAGPVQRSRPARALWIEMAYWWSTRATAAVEAREGLVD